MLRLIAYDIACPRRLRRISDACLDYGLRVQKSLFECWLDEPRFHALWDRLTSLIDEEDDRLVAYILDAKSARTRRTAGKEMKCTAPASFWIL